MYDNTKYFEDIPAVEKPRSRFERSCGHKTTFDTGQLIPIYVDEVLPGDTASLDIAHVTRMTTPIVPVMDNACMDIYAFFCPNRLLWDHWKEFCGENNSTHWEQPVQYEIPQIESPASGFDVGSLADYLGIPTGIAGLSVNHLPFRMYAKVFNDWFRDENLKDPIMFNTDETTLTGVNVDSNYDYVTYTQLGAKPVNAAKFHDYFTSALPEPQKGPDVFVPLGDSAPVVFGESVNASYPTDSNIVGKDALLYTALNSNPNYFTQTYTNEDTAVLQAAGKGNSLLTDLSSATGATINQLRQAFAIQRFYEALARGGSRYTEFVRNIFGVVSPDARQQRSEFLGARRFQINMDQVLQTSSTDAVTPQGNTAAFSCTVNANDLFTYSATEHGFIMILAVVRTTHTYQYGLEKMWNRKKFTDLYVPQFANLGEMPILNKEIYAQGSSVTDPNTGDIVDEEVFGYQEAWAEYRYKPNRVSGKLRSQASGSLDVWTYADKYTQLPMLSGEWIDETKENLQRSLAVQNEPQFVSDFYFKSTWTRVMPVYSVPGLLDHH